MDAFNENNKICHRVKNLVSSMYADDRLIIAKHLMDKINKAKAIKRSIAQGGGMYDLSQLSDDDLIDLNADLQSVINKANERLNALV